MIFKRTLNLLFIFFTFIAVSQNEVCERPEKNSFLELNTIDKCIIKRNSIKENKNKVVLLTRNRIVRRYNNEYINKMMKNRDVNVEGKTK